MPLCPFLKMLILIGFQLLLSGSQQFWVFDYKVIVIAFCLLLLF